MALFQRREHAKEAPLYTMGLNKTILVVGLGNPGTEYDGTRHNIGFGCIDFFATSQDFDPWISKKDLKCQLTSKMLGSVRVICIKPTTFMNLSGEAVLAVAQFYKIPTSQIVVIHDELDIPFGQIRTRVGGSSAGHNGVKSISQIIGENYGRARIGVGPKEPEQMDSADFVLARFTLEQRQHIDPLHKEVTALLTEYIYGDSLPIDTRSFIA